MIRFTCEQCGHKISVQNKHAGKHGKCPECGSAFIVPTESAIIELSCQNCGHKISIPKTHEGKKAKCPACRIILDIPTEAKHPAGGPGVVRFMCSTCNRQIEEPESARGKLVPCPHCSSFVAVPFPEISTLKAEASIQPKKENDESEECFEQLQIGSIREFKQKPNVVTQRKLPWIFDIFLYPLNMSGMAALGIVVFTRFFFRVTVVYLGEASKVFMPCLAFFGLMFGIGIVVRIILYMYLCWYLCECVRGSAAGGVRATETKGYTPGLGEIFGQTIKMGLCFLLYLGPAIFYFKETRETDAIFWCLFVFAAFFFPMSFLATAIFESWMGLNPILLIGSVFSTLLPYTAMILMFIAGGVVIVEKMPNLKESSALTFFVTWLVGVYLAMIVAHLLGWFYYRYEEKLQWDV